MSTKEYLLSKLKEYKEPYSDWREIARNAGIEKPVMRETVEEAFAEGFIEYAHDQFHIKLPLAKVVEKPKAEEKPAERKDKKKK